MTIEKLNNEYVDQYNQFLFSHPSALFNHSIKFKSLLEEYLASESDYYIVLDNDKKIQAVLPLMSSDGNYGTIVNSLPYYGSHGSIIANTEEAYNKLLELYYSIIQNSAASTYIATPFEEEKEIKHDLSETRIGQWTLFQNENIIDLFDSSAKRNIKKAQRCGITVAVENDQLDFLYQTHHQNITSIGGKAKEERFFSLIPKYFTPNEDYNIYIARLNGEKIGALLVFYFKDTVEYFTPAVVEEYKSSQPMPLVILQAMEDAYQKNYRKWNWGGTWLTQDGVYNFKKKFGAVDKPYKYYINVNNKELFKLSKETILKEYDNFYVVPFDKLNLEQL